MTPYYDRDGITIYCGDCAKIIKDIIPDNHIDLTVTSPPYDLVDEDMVTHAGKGLRDYQGYEWDFVSVAKELYRVTATGGVAVWVVGDATVNGSETGSSFRQALYFMKCGFNLHDTMIYQTNKPPMNDNRYQSCFEYMFIFSNGTPISVNIIKELAKHPGVNNSGGMRGKDGNKKDRTRINRTIGNIPKKSIWYIPRSNTSDDRLRDNHPATFPEALARDHIISWSNPGDLILDPFLGSGTTLKMAQQLGRRAIGIDISEDYCKIAVDRLRQPSFFSIPDKPKEQTVEQPTLFTCDPG